MLSEGMPQSSVASSNGRKLSETVCEGVTFSLNPPLRLHPRPECQRNNLQLKNNYPQKEYHYE